MILIGFRHGLRASELCELQWTDVEFETANLHIRRAKLSRLRFAQAFGCEFLIVGTS